MHVRDIRLLLNTRPSLKLPYFICALGKAYQEQRGVVGKGLAFFFFCVMYVPVDGLGWKWISHFYTSIFIEKYLKY